MTGTDKANYENRCYDMSNTDMLVSEKCQDNEQWQNKMTDYRKGRSNQIKKVTTAYEIHWSQKYKFHHRWR